MIKTTIFMQASMLSAMVAVDDIVSGQAG